MQFKRNQVEEAIAGGFGQSELTSELRTRIKRLLDLDRAWGRKQRSSDPVEANFAFSNDAPAGKGSEVWFSSYDVLAIFIGLQMLRSAWPQAHVVKALRQVRGELERHHAAISKRAPEDLLVVPKATKTTKAGDFAIGSSDPVLLTICSPEKHEDKPVSAGICFSQDDCFRFWRSVGRAAGSTMTVIDVTATTAQILPLLLKTEPRSRGRSS